MKKLIVLLMGLFVLSLNLDAREWQTCTVKGYLVSDFEAPSPADDVNGNKWYSENYDDSSWSDVEMPINSFTDHGAYYIRRTVTLDSSYENYDWALYVENDDEADYYVNGTLVGVEGDKISIDKSLLKEGSNIIAAVVRDSGGGQQYLKLNFSTCGSLTQNGFLYELEDGIVYVSDIADYEYTDDTRFETQVSFGGVQYDVTCISHISHLNALYIPETITTIDTRYGGFGNVVSTTYTVDNNNQYFSSLDGSLYNKEQSRLIVGANIKTVVVPEGVTQIDGYGFYGRNNLESISLPSTLTGDLYYTFGNCTNLKSIIIPAGVGAPVYRCFAGCSSLNSIYINKSCPSEIRSDEYSPFADFDMDACTLYVPTGSKTIYEKMNVWSNFKNIVEDESLTVTEINYIDGYRYEIEGDSAVVSDLDYKYDGTEAILETVSLGGKSYPVRKLGSITHQSSFCIPAFISSFSEGRWGTFDCYYASISVSVDSNNQYFAELDGCIYNKEMTKLLFGANKDNLVIPEGVKEICGYAFYGCDSIKNISLPSTLQGGLHRVFSCCTSLQSIDIPYGVTSLDYLCFENCQSLKSVKLPSSLTSIGGGIFRDCTSLTEMTIPASVNDIQGQDFGGCTALSTLNCMVVKPLTINKNVFDKGYWISTSANISTATLRVPHGSKALYEAADVWKDFGTIEEVELYAQEVSVLDGGQCVIPVYMDNQEPFCGIQMDIKLPQGCTFDTNDNGSYKIALGADRFEDLSHTISTKLQDDGSVRVLISSLINENIWDTDINDNDIRNSKPLFTFAVNVAETDASSTVYASYDNVIVTGYVDNQTTKKELPTCYSAINIVNSRLVDISSSNTAWGNVTVNGDGYNANEHNAIRNSVLTFTATPVNGYAFVNWRSSDVEYSQENPLTVTVTDDITLVANFTKSGDVYEDQVVDVADLTSTASIILGNTSDRRTFAAADVYKDNTIDVADYTAIVTLILNGGSSNVAVRHGNRENARLSVNGSAAVGAEGIISIGLDNASDNIANLQFDLELPYGVTLADAASKSVSMTARSVPGHNVAAKEMENGRVRVLLISNENTEIGGSEGAILNIRIKLDSNVAEGEYDIQLSNVVLARSNKPCTKESLINGSLKVESTTNVEAINTSKDQTVFRINGQRTDSSSTGILIKNGKKVLETNK